MVKVVGIKFNNGGRIYYFSPGKLNIKINDNVIVETERGIQFATVATDIISQDSDKVFLPLKDVTPNST